MTSFLFAIALSLVVLFLIVFAQFNIVVDMLKSLNDRVIYLHSELEDIDVSISNLPSSSQVSFEVVDKVRRMRRMQGSWAKAFDSACIVQVGKGCTHSFIPVSNDCEKMKVLGTRCDAQMIGIRITSHEKDSE